MREGPFGLPWFWRVLLLMFGVTAAAVLILAIVDRSNEEAAAARAAAAYSSSSTSTSAQPLAAFIGDSYTQGRGASTASKRWADLVASKEGWQIDNLGRGGTGYQMTSDVNGCGLAFCPNYQSTAKLAVSSGASIVVVAGGQNDFSLEQKDADAEAAAIQATFKTIRAGLPNARIVAVGPSTPGQVTSVVRALDAAVQTSAKSVNATYVSLINPNVIKPSYLLADKAHVDDAGHRAIADRVVDGLK